MTDTTPAEFRKALEKSSDIALPLAEKMMGQGLTAVEEILAPYPPQPDRNRAKSFNTYVRGVGRLPRAAFQGAKIKIKGVAIKRTSERLSTRFRKIVSKSEYGVLGELINTASYSGWVIGSRDTSQDPHQVSWHRDTGWQNVDDALEAAMPKIDEFIDQMLNNFVKAL